MHLQKVAVELVRPIGWCDKQEESGLSSGLPGASGGCALNKIPVLRRCRVTPRSSSVASLDSDFMKKESSFETLIPHHMFCQFCVDF